MTKHPVMQAERDSWILSNGLRVVGERLPHLRTVSVGLWLHVGSMMEEPEESGLSHFMEHMVFKGTTHRTAREIAEEMDAVGGQMNAFTGRDCTCFYAKVIDEDTGLALDMLADLAIHATIPEDELAKERNVVLEEIAMDEDSPEDLVHDLLSATQYADQSMGRSILGPAEQVAAYTREDLLRYRAKHYGPSRAVVSLAGNYDPEAIPVLCEKYFGCWSNTPIEAPIPAIHHVQGTCSKKEKDIEQTQICIGFPGAEYGTKDIFPLAALNTLLGGAMSSRLFQRIREELGMVYSVYSFTNTYRGCGNFAIYAGTSPQNAETVLKEIKAEIDKLLAEGLTEKEYRDAKQQLRANNLMALESSGSRMQSLGRHMLLLNELFDPAESLAGIEAITPESVMDAARKLLSVKPSIAIVGKGVDKLPVEWLEEDK